MQNKKDWLNSFVEKNAWALLIALVGVIGLYFLLQGGVKANSDDIRTIEEAQIIITQNQRDIIELQTIQDNAVEDIKEIKGDVKILLTR